VSCWMGFTLKIWLEGNGYGSSAGSFPKILPATYR
jgi:hypothetical protein